MCDTGMCSGSVPASVPTLSLAQAGGYKATPADMELLRKYKRGISIGFTGRSSLRAKGLLPRKSKKYRGKYVHRSAKRNSAYRPEVYVLGPKYSGTGTDRILKGPSKTRRRQR
jgi:hypothetical protein